MKTISYTLATPRELAKWKDAIERLGRLNDKAYRLWLLYNCYKITLTHARRWKYPIAWLDPDEVKNLVKEIDKVKKAMRAVQDNELGVQLSPDGDLNIVGPSWYTDDQIQKALGGWFIPVIITVGVLALGGLVSRLFYLEKKTDEIAGKYNKVLDATDKAFCSDKNSTACADWRQTKEQENYTPQKSLADRIGEFFSGVGTSVKSGLSIGLLIAIPFAAWLLFGGRRK